MIQRPYAVWCHLPATPPQPHLLILYVLGMSLTRHLHPSSSLCLECSFPGHLNGLLSHLLWVLAYMSHEVKPSPLFIFPFTLENLLLHFSALFSSNAYSTPFCLCIACICTFCLPPQECMLRGQGFLSVLHEKLAHSSHSLNVGSMKVLYLRCWRAIHLEIPSRNLGTQVWSLEGHLELELQRWDSLACSVKMMSPGIARREEGKDRILENNHMWGMGG